MTIDHPSHYQGKELEAIDVIEAFDLNFNLGNVIKYVLRAGKKGDRIEDLEKALWYLNREMTGKDQEFIYELYEMDMLNHKPVYIKTTESKQEAKQWSASSPYRSWQEKKKKDNVP